MCKIKGDFLPKKKICRYCNKVVEDNHICSKNEKKQQYNKYKREYYQNNKEMILELTSAKWRRFRKIIISRDNHMCQRCLLKYGLINGENLEVHHIKPRVEYPELMYEEKNVITLCKTCNLQLGTTPSLDFDWENPEIELKI